MKRKPKQDEQHEQPLYEEDVDLREMLERFQNREQFARDFEREDDQ